MDEIEKINKELDIELIEYLELIDLYQSQRKRTNFLLHNGFLELAHSKYIMGPSKISRYQYDQRMQATTKIDIISEELINVGSEEEQLDISKLKFVMTTNSTPNATSSTGSPQQELLAAGEVAVRQRSKAPTPKSSTLPSTPTQPLNETDIFDDKKQDFPMVEITNKEERSEVIKRDPVNWFGVLSPPSLKNAQANFQQSILELTSSANLQLRLKIREERVLKLMKQKEEAMKRLH